MQIGVTTQAGAMTSLERRVPPPIVFLVMLLACWIIARVSPALAIGATLPRWFGGGLAAGGVLLGIAGAFEFRRPRTTIDPVRIEAASSLVTSGVFRVTRNPMYLGLAIILVGAAIFLRSPFALVGPAAFVAFIWRFQITPEERVMRAKFGAAYEAYRRRVRAWL